MLVIGTYRPEDLLPAPDGSEHTLQSFLRTAAADNLITRVELGRLDGNAVAEMARAVLDPSDQTFKIDPKSDYFTIGGPCSK